VPYLTGEKIEIYGQVPIEDCTSGVCYPGYLWWNGYIPPTDQQPRRQRETQRNHGRAVQLQAGRTAADSGGLTALPRTLRWNQPAAVLDTNMSDSIEQRNGSDHVQRRLAPVAKPIFRTLQWFQDVVVQVRAYYRAGDPAVQRDFFNVFNHPEQPTGVAGTGILDNAELAVRRA
jgi:hypothetical protein